MLYSREELLIVPRMRQSDDKLLIIEMTRVSPPFLLDFVAGPGRMSLCIEA